MLRTFCFGTFSTTTTLKGPYGNYNLIITYEPYNATTTTTNNLICATTNMTTTNTNDNVMPLWPVAPPQDIFGYISDATTTNTTAPSNTLCAPYAHLIITFETATSTTNKLISVCATTNATTNV